MLGGRSLFGARPRVPSARLRPRLRPAPSCPQRQGLHSDRSCYEWTPESPE